MLSAPPGSGKTTQVPLALLQSETVNGRILLLQPRRVAARSVATWMAHLIGESVGQQIGYQVRHERKISEETHIEVLTEGLIMQRLLQDPELSGVDVVILDEFHERSLLSDLTLMMLLEARILSREDLKILIMSATLDIRSLAARFDAPIIIAEGRSYPLQLSYIEHKLNYSQRLISQYLIDELSSFWLNDVSLKNRGHCLVFLPGRREIEEAREQILRTYPQCDVEVLYGSLPLHKQRKVLSPSQVAKVILATNIAETSLTIDGVTHVIDSGLYRTSRCDPKTGLNRLVTLPIAHDSATQRAGRAGRTQEGRCLRLWSEHDHKNRVTQTAPEVSYAPLIESVLKIAFWSGDWRLFEWFESPPQAALRNAVEELVELGALDQNTNQLSVLGECLATLPIHPRRGLALIWARALNCLEEVAFMCALSELNHDPLSANKQEIRTLDPWLRWTVYQNEQNMDCQHGYTVFGREFILTIKQLKRYVSRLNIDRLKLHKPNLSQVSTLKERVAYALAQSTPRGIARLRERSREDKRTIYHLSGGGEARLVSEIYNDEMNILVVLKSRLNLHDEPVIELALPIKLDWLSPIKAHHLRFDERLGGVYEHQIGSLGHLILWEKTYPAPKHSIDAQSLFRASLKKDLWQWIPLETEAIQWLERLSWLSSQSELIDHLEASLHHPLPIWSLQYEDDRDILIEQLLDHLVDGCTHTSHFSPPKKLLPLLKGLTPPKWVEALDHYVPSHYILPTGRTVNVIYTPNQPPMIKAYLQAFFGETEHPHLGLVQSPWRVALQLHLLAPNQRVTQITSDLTVFWQHSYLEVRRQLRGRYPKHHWPENPLSIGPQSGAKKRSKR